MDLQLLSEVGTVLQDLTCGVWYYFHVNSIRIGINCRAPSWYPQRTGENYCGKHSRISNCLLDTSKWISRKHFKRSMSKMKFIFLPYFSNTGFYGSSAGKESAYNAGDSGSIPGSGRSTGKGIGYPLQYFWAFPVAQLAKNSPAMWETWVWFLGWEDSLGKGTATQSSILAWDYIVYGVAKSRTQLSGFHFHFPLTCSASNPHHLSRGYHLDIKLKILPITLDHDYDSFLFFIPLIQSVMSYNLLKA